MLLYSLQFADLADKIFSNGSSNNDLDGNSKYINSFKKYFCGAVLI
jgi:hypothetical protein